MVETLKMPVDESPDLEKRFDLKTFAEYKYFALEICDMVDEGKAIDLGRAARNAKYLAEIERRAKDIKSGKNVISFTDEEWEKFIDEKNVS